MRAVLVLFPLCLACSGSPTVVRPDTDGSDPAADAASPPEEVDEPTDTDLTDAAEAPDTTETPALQPGVYQGTLAFTVTRDVAAAYSGKLGVKVRADGVFSGTGTAASAGQPAAAIKVSGFVDEADAEGTLELTLAGADPVEIPLNGTGSGQTLTLTFNGGSQNRKVQGSVELIRTGE